MPAMTHAGIEIIRDQVGTSQLMPSTLHERRENLEAMAGVVPAPEGVTVEPFTLAGRPAERLIPDAAADGQVVLYLHGGGYISGSLDTHRGLAGGIALRAGVTVVTLDYRLAPEDPFPAALNDALLAFDQLCPARIAIMGDSAGGGLAVATAIALRDRAGTVPVALALFSPWTDLTQSAASMLTEGIADPMLTKDALDQMADGYLAGTDPRTPFASPLFGDLGTLPPTRIDVGSDEILLDDSTALAARAEAAGVGVTIRVWPDMIHVFPAFPVELVPEAGECLDLAATFVADHLRMV